MKCVACLWVLFCFGLVGCLVDLFLLFLCHFVCLVFCLFWFYLLFCFAFFLVRFFFP